MGRELRGHVPFDPRDDSLPDSSGRNVDRICIDIQGRLWGRIQAGRELLSPNDLQGGAKNLVFDLIPGQLKG